MVERALTVIALVCVVSCSRLSPEEQKLIGSWQTERSPGERLIETFEPDRTHWILFFHDGNVSLNSTSRWHIDQKKNWIVFDHVSYYRAPDQGRPQIYAVVINEIREQTLRLAQRFTYTRCARPEKPSIPQSSP